MPGYRAQAADFQGCLGVRHGEEATIEALRPEPRGEGYPFDADDIAAWIRAGNPLFR
ncbi:MAG: hypothetical protein AB7S70_09585 [Hyphomicrobium sp.]|uniref:hypothetical protein n=1 Tax=Hyphomicrobium sp. TaxID=82 RepID=UPI003D0B97C1